MLQGRQRGMSRAECDAFNHMHFARLQSAYGKRGVTPKVPSSHPLQRIELRVLCRNMQYAEQTDINSSLFPCYKYLKLSPVCICTPIHTPLADSCHLWFQTTAPKANLLVVSYSLASTSNQKTNASNSLHTGCKAAAATA